MIFVYIFLTFVLAFVFGYEVGRHRKSNLAYDGIMVVKEDLTSDKIVYSLEMNEDLESLQFADKVVFQVVSSENH